jgi:glycosyltransferase involved in cell wall biosynthesis
MVVNDAGPAIVVISSLFPSEVRTGAGLFVRERMFRVAEYLPMTVISPQPWSPLDALIRRFLPRYRRLPLPVAHQDGIEVRYPRFFALPGITRWLDGWAMALALRSHIRALRDQGRAQVLDSHFAYPDGFAATRLGAWFGLPVTITLRGTEPRTAGYLLRGKLQSRALLGADKVFAVADSLRQLALRTGVPDARTRVIGNGVDEIKFQPLDRAQARKDLQLPPDATVIISVGGLVERKGFHRVIELLPALRQEFADLHYLVVGGASPEGDWSGRLRDQAASLGLNDVVHFLGPWPPEHLKVPLSAADVFVLATSNEGWANVFLEAMACGLPVVTTDVGGNTEVVCGPSLGTVVPFGKPAALQQAIAEALRRHWDRAVIRAHAEANNWAGRVQILLEELRAVAKPR